MAAISKGSHHLLIAISISTLRPRFSLSFSSSSSSSQSLPPPPSPISDDQDTRIESLVSSVVSIIKENGSKSRWNFIKTVYPSGFSPNEVSQITLRIRNNPRLALRFFLWSEKKSLCAHDILSYSTIIHILARARLQTLALNLIQTAIRISEEFNGDHSSNPPKTFEMLTKTYRFCDSALFVFDLLIQLRSRSIYPKASICNSLIRSVLKLRGSDAGLSMYGEFLGLMKRMTVILQIEPIQNVQTFTLMLCFYQYELVEKVEELWIEMGKLDGVPKVSSQ